MLTGHFKLPHKEEMLAELIEEERKKVGRPSRKYHQLGEEQGHYFENLAETANIKKVPPVIHNLYLRVRMGRNLNDCFRIIDDNNWEQVF